MISWDKLRQVYSYGPPAPGIMQKYIYSPTNKATLYRIVFFNPNNSNERASYGYCLTNKKNYFSPKTQIENRCLHLSENTNSYIVYNINGKTIRDYEFYSHNLCTFLERSYNIKIEKMVLDFAKDELGNIFFLTVKSFELVDTKVFNQLADMSDAQKTERILEIQERAEKTNNTVQCTLCRINFKKSEITKIVSMNMLFELKQHLNKRGIFKFEYLERFRGYQLSCKVCDLCYLLIVAEHELIEVEKLFGGSLNIPVKDESEGNKKKATGVVADMLKEMESRKISSDRFKDHLLQWRLLFYFQDLHDKTLTELGDMASSGKVYLHVKVRDNLRILV